MVRRAGGLASAALRLLDPAVLAGNAVESVWLAAHVTTWPVGLVGGRGARAERAYRLEHLPPVQRGLLVSNVEAAGTPILLVHGIVSNRSIFTLLRRGLTRRGFSNVFAMNYLTVANDVRAAAAGLSVEVERIVEETGFERIHIIGHSLGGLVARYYVTRLGRRRAGAHPDHARHPAPGQLRRVRRADHADAADAAGQPPDARARPPGAGLPHPVHLVLVRQRPGRSSPQRNAALRHRDLGARNIKLHGAGHLTPADAAARSCTASRTPWPTSTRTAAR